MKTQILRLEPHDDVVSARDKMGWSQTGRILLVWPERGRVLTRQIDLVLLQRHSSLLGAQLALITRDQDVLYNARQLSIPVYKNLARAQKSHWRTGRRATTRQRRLLNQRPKAPAELEALRQQAYPPPPTWTSRPIIRIGLFSLGVLAILSIAAILLPGAVIEITPQSKDQSIDLEVHANPALDSINLSGAVPAIPITTTVQGIRSMPTHGRTNISDQYATGLVSFSNLTDQPVIIPKDTVVRTVGASPARFAVTQAGTVPAGTTASVMLRVRAIEPGTGGNLPAASLTILEGQLGTLLAVNNPASTSGGTSRSVPAPTPKDRQDLYQQLLSELSQQAIAALEKIVSPGDLLLTPTLTITQVLDNTYDPVGEQPSEELQLSLKLEFRVFKVLKADLNALAASILDANMPEGYAPVSGSLTVKSLINPSIGTDQMAHWELRGQRRLQALIQPSGVVSLVVGLPAEVATARLKGSLPVQGTSQIRMMPAWWPRLPFLPFRISVFTRDTGQ